MTLQGLNLKLIGIIEDEEKINRKEVFGFELKGVHQLEALKPDAVLITSFTGQDARKEKLGKFIDLEKVHVANISTS